MTVHAIEPRCDPAAARFEKSDADLRVALADAAPDHRHRRQHHLHRMRNDVAGAVALEAIDPDRRHAAGAGAALMEPDREVEILGGSPERLVHRVMHHMIFVVRVWPEKAAREA